MKQVVDNAADGSEKKEIRIAYTSFYSLSKVGYVPFNQGKVNQDRACEVAPFGKAKEKALFGVFDGHGQQGHLVSQFIATNLPRYGTMGCFCGQAVSVFFGLFLVRRDGQPKEFSGLQKKQC